MCSVAPVHSVGWADIKAAMLLQRHGHIQATAVSSGRQEMFMNSYRLWLAAPGGRVQEDGAPGGAPAMRQARVKT